MIFTANVRTRRPIVGGAETRFGPILRTDNSGHFCREGHIRRCVLRHLSGFDQTILAARCGETILSVRSPSAATIELTDVGFAECGKTKSLTKALPARRRFPRHNRSGSVYLLPGLLTFGTSTPRAVAKSIW